MTIHPFLSQTAHKLLDPRFLNGGEYITNMRMGDLSINQILSSCILRRWLIVACPFIFASSTCLIFVYLFSLALFQICDVVYMYIAVLYNCVLLLLHLNSSQTYFIITTLITLNTQEFNNKQQQLPWQRLL